MNPLNFNHLKRGDVRESNYSLRDRKLELKAKVTPLYEQQGTDVWETEGGAPPPLPYEVQVDYRRRDEMRLRGSRKQRAAKMNVPKESIKVVNMVEAAPLPVAKARYEGKTEQEVRIIELELQLNELRTRLRRPANTMPGEPVVDLDSLLRNFETRKVR